MKTFYCNRAITGNSFQPYDLVVVPRAEVNKEYFSISYDGVVHYKVQEVLAKICLEAKKHGRITF